MRGTTPSADGVAIVFEDRGHGPDCVVLVHGWSCDRSYWDAQVATLAECRRVVTIDLAGHGESGRDRAAWTIASFAQDVVAVVNALALERMVLVGHSMGGDVIVEAAHALPGRVAGLVWIDVYRTLDRPATADEIESWLEAFGKDFAGTTRSFVRSMFPAGADPALVRRVSEGMAGAPPDIAIPVARAARNFGREMPAALARLDLPACSIQPDDGEPDDGSLARHGIRVERLGGVGHFPMLEAPAAFNAALGRVVARMLEPERPDASRM
jgi:pimeloyl-ACP methyl ester carboxylesterase